MNGDIWQSLIKVFMWCVVYITRKDHYGLSMVIILSKVTTETLWTPRGKICAIYRYKKHTLCSKIEIFKHKITIVDILHFWQKNLLTVTQWLCKRSKMQFKYWNGACAIHFLNYYIENTHTFYCFFLCDYMV